MHRLAAILAILATLGLTSCDPATIASLAAAIGIPEGTETVPYNGPQNITTNNLVLDGYHFDEGIQISASNVTIRNSLIETGGRDYGIRVATDPAIDHTFQDIDIVGMGTGTLECQYGVGFAHYTADGVDVSNCEDAFKIQKGTITGSLCRDLIPGGGNHADCVQISNGPGPVTATGNFFFAPFRQSNATFQICNDNALVPITIDNVLIEGNVLSGGNVLVNGCVGTGEVVIRNNYLEGFSTRNAQNPEWPEDPNPALHHAFIVNLNATHCGNVWYDNTEEYPTGSSEPFPADSPC